MAEWTTFLAVFWVLWALDGARFAARPVGFVIAWGRARRARVHHGRGQWNGGWPGTWRVTSEDVPFALSPIGIVNRGIGMALRPAEQPVVARAWRWEDIREVGVAKGWIFINGLRFCPDTGHLPAARLLSLARLAAPQREAQIRQIVLRWLRPAHLRRRARSLVGRTRVVAALNGIMLLGLVASTAYIVTDGAARLSPAQATAIAKLAPLFFLELAGLHVVAVVLALRARRRLKAVTADRRGAALFSALLLPPQGLRLRALLAEGFFPPQHPAAMALAFARRDEAGQAVFNTLSDVRWPIHGGDDPTAAAEIRRWFGAVLEATLLDRLRAAGMAGPDLLSAPAPDSPSSRVYCPRCRAQFVGEKSHCPHGIGLLPVRSTGNPPARERA